MGDDEVARRDLVPASRQASGDRGAGLVVVGADIEACWYIGQYVLPGNVQRVILKPKALPLRTLGVSVPERSLLRLQ